VEHDGFISEEGCTFIEKEADLAIELAYGPAAPQSFSFVEGAGLGVIDRQKPDVVGPG
jgi:hypothetical protein